MTSLKYKSDTKKEIDAHEDDSLLKNAARYRELARKEAQLRQAAFQASKNAYRANRKAEAKHVCIVLYIIHLYIA